MASKGRETTRSSAAENALRESLQRLSATEASIKAKILGLKNELESIISKKEVVQAQLMEVLHLELSQDWAVETHKWSKQLREVMKDYFGLSVFRKNQLEVMNCLLSRNDALLIMPTGGGKSLCFQVPALIRNCGLTLVVSPLISLMHDQYFIFFNIQVMALRAINIFATYFTSQNSKDEAAEIRDAMKMLHAPLLDSQTKAVATLRFLYITPERIAKSKYFMSSLEKIHDAGNLSMIVIDEVHCVSQWGHAFRQDYLRLSLLKKHFQHVPLLLLTATATAEVVTDVKKVLDIPFCQVFRSHINRHNLFYEVRYKPKQPAEVIQLLASFIKQFPSNYPGIIYCISRKDAQIVCEALMKNFNIICAFYHSDVDTQTRLEIHTKWSEGLVQVVVATVAFGMGINKEDVRFVIHHTLPKSPENYYQETGRAGRDGKLAHCLLLYRSSDVCRHSVMVYWEATGLKLLYKMVNLCTQRVCRRQFLCDHFGDAYVNCNSMCDICLYKNEKMAAAAPSNTEVIEIESTSGNLKRQKLTITPEGCSISTHPYYSCDIALLKQAIKSLLNFLYAIKEDSNRKNTLLQLQTEWKKRLSIQNFGDHAALADSEMLQAIIINLVVSNALKEDFYHTAYSTNSYIQLSEEGIVLYKLLEGDGNHYQTSTINFKLFNGSPYAFSLYKIRTNALLIVPWKSIGAEIVLEQKLRNSQAFRECYKLLKSMAKKLGREIGVSSHYILNDTQIQNIFTLCEKAQQSNFPMISEDLVSVLPKMKIEIYCERLLISCNECVKIMESLTPVV
ncbi:ATP-dependent Dna helicase, RecQ family protein [Cardiosporidium cionae]|uniref:ATP-dependent DNA helicase n=1 Tax=Cardiosporidium cionae TaxID=476202 RepID=A0ABQ7J946_9APIC|nr:ATP-dependent Dna helicase, RecQ family protein [Cardiosporidium cionae]|eukprot:KAF8820522.1 ATP-dependent Dna helicase, RecQ family protein [Cardiosporidium cionae]